MTAERLSVLDAHHLQRRSAVSHFAEGRGADRFHASVTCRTGDGHGLLAFRHHLDWVDPARRRDGAGAQQVAADVALDRRRGRPPGSLGAADPRGCEASGLRRLRWPQCILRRSCLMTSRRSFA